MRRFGILLLTVAMICALSVSAFADGSKTITDITEELPVLDVRATFSQGSSDVAYSVDISWGGMQFKYTVEADTWNPNEHEWIVNNNGEWSVMDNSNWIKIENNSSTAVKATFDYSSKQGYESIDGAFACNAANGEWSNDALTMPKPGVGVDAEIYELTFAITSGTLAKHDQPVVVGQINITLEDATPAT